MSARTRPTGSEAKRWARENLSGYVGVLFTPYDERGLVDAEALRRDVRTLLARNHLGGLYVGSIYQEFWLLSTDERKAIAETVVQEVAGAVPVIVSASHNELRTAVHLASHAADIGADLVMLWPPHFGPRGDRELVGYFASVTSSVDVGFAFYNSGLGEMNHEMALDALRQIADIENVCLLKEASLRQDVFLSTLAALGDRILVSSPLEEYWAAGKALFPSVAPDVLLGSSRYTVLQPGGAGLMDDIFASTMAGRFEQAGRGIASLLTAAEGIHARALRSGIHPVGLMKALGGHLGLSGGAPRIPIPAPDAADVRRALEGLVALGVVDPGWAEGGTHDG